ncbi:unnamed protein product, partial [Mesorhabditis belari]|uniref:Glutaredoxin domain-containing protein n=1 Tax=Mesorhabditis belari TaxID=2138241 RepID=A0AAF3EA50_9BILA
MGAFQSRVDEEGVRKAVDSQSVVMFTKSACSYCVKAKNLLNEQKVDYKEIDFDALKQQNPNEHQGLVNGLVYMTKITGVPQIFICGKFIGGFTELSELHEAKTLLEKISECTKEND